jgi:signal peptidase II
MMIKHTKSFLVGLIVLGAVLVLDQISKWYLLDVAGFGLETVHKVTSFFNLVLVRNYGISFGMLSGHNQPMLLTIGALIIISILTKWLVKSAHPLTSAAIGAVIGGAIGNVIDRVRFGAVTDFLDFHLMGYHWPAFNIADSCIFMGVVVLCFQSMFDPASKKVESLL